MEIVITEADLGAVERWFAATLNQCRKLRNCQRHVAAENCAAGALRLLRTMRETQADHGFFADLLILPAESAFHGFMRDEAEFRPCPCCGEKYGHAFNCSLNQK